MVIEELISNEYMRFLVVVLSFFLIAKISYWISTKILRKLTSKAKLNDTMFNSIRGPTSALLFFLGIALGLGQLSLSDDITKVITGINSTMIILFICLLISRAFNVFVYSWGKRSKHKLDNNLVHLFDYLFNLIIYILAFLMILGSVWDVQVAPLIASLGIAGIAVAFALQTTLGNIFGGISLLMDKNISEGDIIEIDGGRKGTVIDIGFRSTKIKTFDNEELIVPNGILSNSILQNYAKPDFSLRVVVPFGVAYGSDVEKVKKVVTKEVKKIKGYQSEPEAIVRFLQMADSSLNFTVYFWIADYTLRFNSIDEANTRIYNALNKAKIKIPFPQRDIHIKGGRR
jgi:small-conductance mechanosensitive channel